MTKQQTILIVDDDEFALEINSVHFRSAYRVITATSGEEALEKATTEHPDLIILDVVMPEMNGYEVLRRLKLDPQTKDVPVVFLTSRDQEEEEAEGLKLGALDYWVKPFSHDIARIRAQNLIELKCSRDKLAEMAMIDGLTGITNRRGFDDLLDQEWGRGNRSRSPLALILVDIDHFKLFNDTYGHTAGDYCLRAVAGAFSNNLVRTTDRAARYGGEEFACILPATDQNGALEIAEKLRQAIEDLAIPHECSMPAGVVTASFGVVSLIPTKDDNPSYLINLADQALYCAKDKGRNRVLGAPDLIRKVS